MICPSFLNKSGHRFVYGRTTFMMAAMARNFPVVTGPLKKPTDVRQLLLDREYELAFRASLTEHGASVGRFCMSLLSHQSDSEDAAQETFVEFHKSLAGYRGDGSVIGFLLTIARRVCYKMLVKRKKANSRLRVVTPEAALSSLDIATKDVDAKAVRRALEKLKPSDRECLLLRFQADNSYQDIAIAFDVDQAAARKRVSRALARFKDIYTNL